MGCVLWERAEGLALVGHPHQAVSRGDILAHWRPTRANTEQAEGPILSHLRQDRSLFPIWKDGPHEECVCPLVFMISHMYKHLEQWFQPS